MNNTKIIVVSHQETVSTESNGADLTEKIEQALAAYSSSHWQVRSATTAIEAPRLPDDQFRSDATYATTIILDRIK